MKKDFDSAENNLFSVNENTYSSAVISSSILTLENGDKAYFTKVLRGGILELKNGSYTSQTYIYDSGTMRQSDGYSLNTSIYGGGKMIIYGGSANEISVSSKGSFYIYSGGTATHVSLGNGGSATISGGTASHVDIDNGRVDVLSGGTILDVFGKKNAALYVSSGGRAEDISSFSGKLQLNSGGQATNINFVDGTFYVLDGAEAVNVQLVGGSSFLQSGGIMRNAVCESNSYLTISSGGIMGGTWLNRGYLSVNSGAVVRSDLSLTIDISNWRSATSYITAVTNLTVFNQNDISVNVSSSSALGKYNLSSNALQFNATVNCLVDGVNLGEFRYDAVANVYNSLRRSTRNYSLYFKGNSLYLSIDVNYNGLVIGSGGDMMSLQVTSGIVAEKLTVVNGGILNVLTGGTAGGSLSSGGKLLLNSGGIVTGTFAINHGGTVIVYGGTAADLQISEGAQATFYLNLHGTFAGTIDGQAFVYSGNSGGGFLIRDGIGVALSGGVLRNTTIRNGGVMNVSSDGRTEIVNMSGGSLNIFSGGMGNDTVVDSGGVVRLSGGIMSGVELLSGEINVSSDGSVLSLEIKNGNLNVFSGGSVVDFNMSDGVCVTHEGSVLDQGTLIGGTINIHGGRVSNMIVDGADVSIKSGELNTFTQKNGSLSVYGGSAFSLTIDGGSLNLHNSCQMANVYLSKNAILNVYTLAMNISSGRNSDNSDFSILNGYAYGLLLNNTGSIRIGSGERAEAIRLNDSSTAIVEGGSLNDVTVGGSCSITITSGGSIVNGKIFGSALMGDGTFKSLVISSGGHMIVRDGGSGSGVNIKQDGVLQLTGGVIDDLHIAAGAQLTISKDVNYANTVNNLTREANSILLLDFDLRTKISGKNISGEAFTVTGGKASGIELIHGDRLLVNRDMTVENAIIGELAEIRVSAGGAFTNGIIKKGGLLQIAAGGIVNGKLKLAGAMNIIGAVEAAGLELNFDLRGKDPDAKVQLNNSSFLQNAKAFAVTVNQSQQIGQYLLAGGAAVYNSYITIYGAGSESLILNVNGMISIGSYTYSLSNTNGILTLTIENDSQPIFLTPNWPAVWKNAPETVQLINTTDVFHLADNDSYIAGMVYGGATGIISGTEIIAGKSSGSTDKDIYLQINYAATSGAPVTVYANDGGSLSGDVYIDITGYCGTFYTAKQESSNLSGNLHLNLSSGRVEHIIFSNKGIFSGLFSVTVNSGIIDGDILGGGVDSNAEIVFNDYIGTVGHSKSTASGFDRWIFTEDAAVVFSGNWMTDAGDEIIFHLNGRTSSLSEVCLASTTSNLENVSISVKADFSALENSLEWRLLAVSGDWNGRSINVNDNTLIINNKTSFFTVDSISWFAEYYNGVLSLNSYTLGVETDWPKNWINAPDTVEVTGSGNHFLADEKRFQRGNQVMGALINDSISGGNIYAVSSTGDSHFDAYLRMTSGSAGVVGGGEKYSLYGDFYYYQTGGQVSAIAAGQVKNGDVNLIITGGDVTGYISGGTTSPNRELELSGYNGKLTASSIYDFEKVKLTGNTCLTLTATWERIGSLELDLTSRSSALSETPVLTVKGSLTGIAILTITIAAEQLTRSWQLFSGVDLNGQTLMINGSRYIVGEYDVLRDGKLYTLTCNEMLTELGVESIARFTGLSWPKNWINAPAELYLAVSTNGGTYLAEHETYKISDGFGAVINGSTLSDLTVYGGAKNAKIAGNIYLQLLNGEAGAIYGAGNYAVGGNVKIYLVSGSAKRVGAVDGDGSIAGDFEVLYGGGTIGSFGGDKDKVNGESTLNFADFTGVVTSTVANFDSLRFSGDAAITLSGNITQIGNYHFNLTGRSLTLMNTAMAVGLGLPTGGLFLTVGASDLAQEGIWTIAGGCDFNGLSVSINSKFSLVVGGAGFDIGKRKYSLYSESNQLYLSVYNLKTHRVTWPAGWSFAPTEVYEIISDVVLSECSALYGVNGGVGAILTAGNVQNIYGAGSVTTSQNVYLQISDGVVTNVRGGGSGSLMVGNVFYHQTGGQVGHVLLGGAGSGQVMGKAEAVLTGGKILGSLSGANVSDGATLTVDGNVQFSGTLLGNLTSLKLTVNTNFSMSGEHVVLENIGQVEFSLIDRPGNTTAIWHVSNDAILNSKIVISVNYDNLNSENNFYVLSEGLEYGNSSFFLSLNGESFAFSDINSLLYYGQKVFRLSYENKVLGLSYSVSHLDWPSGWNGPEIVENVDKQGICLGDNLKYSIAGGVAGLISSNLGIGAITGGAGTAVTKVKDTYFRVLNGGSIGILSGGISDRFHVYTDGGAIGEIFGAVSCIEEVNIYLAKDAAVGRVSIGNAAKATLTLDSLGSNFTTKLHDIDGYDGNGTGNSTIVFKNYSGDFKGSISDFALLSVAGNDSGVSFSQAAVTNVGVFNFDLSARLTANAGVAMVTGGMENVAASAFSITIDQSKLESIAGTTYRLITAPDEEEFSLQNRTVSLYDLNGIKIGEFSFDSAISIKNSNPLYCGDYKFVLNYMENKSLSMSVSYREPDMKTVTWPLSVSGAPELLPLVVNRVKTLSNDAYKLCGYIGDADALTVWDGVYSASSNAYLQIGVGGKINSLYLNAPGANYLHISGGTIASTVVGNGDKSYISVDDRAGELYWFGNVSDTNLEFIHIDANSHLAFSSWNNINSITLRGDSILNSGMVAEGDGVVKKYAFDLSGRDVALSASGFLSVISGDYFSSSFVEAAFSVENCALGEWVIISNYDFNGIRWTINGESYWVGSGERLLIEQKFHTLNMQNGELVLSVSSALSSTTWLLNSNKRQLPAEMVLVVTTGKLSDNSSYINSDYIGGVLKTTLAGTLTVGGAGNLDSMLLLTGGDFTGTIFGASDSQDGDVYLEIDANSKFSGSLYVGAESGRSSGDAKLLLAGSIQGKIYAGGKGAVNVGSSMIEVLSTASLASEIVLDGANVGNGSTLVINGYLSDSSNSFLIKNFDSIELTNGARLYLSSSSILSNNKGYVFNLSSANSATGGILYSYDSKNIQLDGNVIMVKWDESASEENYILSSGIEWSKDILFGVNGIIATEGVVQSGKYLYVFENKAFNSTLSIQRTSAEIDVLWPENWTNMPAKLVIVREGLNLMDYSDRYTLTNGWGGAVNNIQLPQGSICIGSSKAENVNGNGYLNMNDSLMATITGSGNEKRNGDTYIYVNDSTVSKSLTIGTLSTGNLNGNAYVTLANSNVDVLTAGAGISGNVTVVSQGEVLVGAFDIATIGGRSHAVVKDGRLTVSRSFGDVDELTITQSGAMHLSGGATLGKIGKIDFVFTDFIYNSTALLSATDNLRLDSSTTAVHITLDCDITNAAQSTRWLLAENVDFSNIELTIGGNYLGTLKLGSSITVGRRELSLTMEDNKVYLNYLPEKVTVFWPNGWASIFGNAAAKVLNVNDDKFATLNYFNISGNIYSALLNDQSIVSDFHTGDAAGKNTALTVDSGLFGAIVLSGAAAGFMGNGGTMLSLDMQGVSNYLYLNGTRIIDSITLRGQSTNHIFIDGKSQIDAVVQSYAVTDVVFEGLRSGDVFSSAFTSEHGIDSSGGGTLTFNNCSTIINGRLRGYQNIVIKGSGSSLYFNHGFSVDSVALNDNGQHIGFGGGDYIINNMKLYPTSRSVSYFHARKGGFADVKSHDSNDMTHTLYFIGEGGSAKFYDKINFEDMTLSEGSGISMNKGSVVTLTNHGFIEHRDNFDYIGSGTSLNRDRNLYNEVNGTISVIDGTTYLKNCLQNRGVLQIGVAEGSVNANFSIGDPSLFMQNQIFLESSGSIHVGSHGKFYVSGSDSKIQLELTDKILKYQHTVNVDNHMLVDAGGLVDGFGVFDISNNGIIDNYGNFLFKVDVYITVSLKPFDEELALSTAYYGGVFKNSGTINNYGNFCIGNYDDIPISEAVDGINSQNSGTIINQSGGIMTLGNALKHTGTLTNAGVFNFVSRSKLEIIGGSFTNDGTINGLAFSFLIDKDSSFLNNGTINPGGYNNVSSISVDGLFTNNGNFSHTGGSFHSIRPDGLEYNYYKSSFSIGPKALINNNGTMNFGGVIALSMAGGVWHNNGDINFNLVDDENPFNQGYSSLNFSNGEFNNDIEGTLRYSGVCDFVLSGNAKFVNSGKMYLSDNFLFKDSASFVNWGTLTIESNANFVVGQEFSGSIKNNGTIIYNSIGDYTLPATMPSSGRFVVTQGTLTIKNAQANLEVGRKGTLKLNGSSDSTLIMEKDACIELSGENHLRFSGTGGRLTINVLGTQVAANLYDNILLDSFDTISLAVVGGGALFSDGVKIIEMSNENYRLNNSIRYNVTIQESIHGIEQNFELVANGNKVMIAGGYEVYLTFGNNQLTLLMATNDIKTSGIVWKSGISAPTALAEVTVGSSNVVELWSLRYSLSGEINADFGALITDKIQRSDLNLVTSESIYSEISGGNTFYLLMTGGKVGKINLQFNLAEIELNGGIVVDSVTLSEHSMLYLAGGVIGGNVHTTGNVFWLSKASEIAGSLIVNELTLQSGGTFSGSLTAKSVMLLNNETFYFSGAGNIPQLTFGINRDYMDIAKLHITTPLSNNPKLVIEHAGGVLEDIYQVMVIGSGLKAAFADSAFSIRLNNTSHELTYGKITKDQDGMLEYWSIASDYFGDFVFYTRQQSDVLTIESNTDYVNGFLLTDMSNSAVLTFGTSAALLDRMAGLKSVIKGTRLDNTGTISLFGRNIHAIGLDGYEIHNTGTVSVFHDKLAIGIRGETISLGSASNIMVTSGASGIAIGIFGIHTGALNGIVSSDNYVVYDGSLNSNGTLSEGSAADNFTVNGVMTGKIALNGGNNEITFTANSSLTGVVSAHNGTLKMTIIPGAAVYGIGSCGTLNMNFALNSDSRLGTYTILGSVSNLPSSFQLGNIGSIMSNGVLDNAARNRRYISSTSEGTLQLNIRELYYELSLSSDLNLSEWRTADNIRVERGAVLSLSAGGVVENGITVSGVLSAIESGFTLGAGQITLDLTDSVSTDSTRLLGGELLAGRLGAIQLNADQWGNYILADSAKIASEQLAIHIDGELWEMISIDKKYFRRKDAKVYSYEFVRGVNHELILSVKFGQDAIGTYTSTTNDVKLILSQSGEWDFLVSGTADSINDVISVDGAMHITISDINNNMKVIGDVYGAGKNGHIKNGVTILSYNADMNNLYGSNGSNLTVVDNSNFAVNITLTGCSVVNFMAGGINGSIVHGNVQAEFVNFNGSNLNVAYGAGAARVTGNVSLTFRNTVTSISGNIYGGVMLNNKYALDTYQLTGSTYLFFVNAEVSGIIFGGSYVAYEGKNQITGSTNLSFDNKTNISNWVFGGGYGNFGGEAISGEVAMTVSGAKISYLVGGGRADSKSLVVSKAQTGDISISITGGIISEGVFGGGYVGNNGLITAGNVELKVDCTAATTLGTVYLGGYSFGNGTISVGNTLARFTGSGENLSFNNTLDGKGNNSNVTLTGTATLMFDNYTGNFAATVRNFDAIEFKSGGVIFTSEQNFSAIKSYTFHIDSKTPNAMWTQMRGDLGITGKGMLEKNIVITADFIGTDGGKLTLIDSDWSLIEKLTGALFNLSYAGTEAAVNVGNDWTERAGWDLDFKLALDQATGDLTLEWREHVPLVPPDFKKSLKLDSYAADFWAAPDLALASIFPDDDNSLHHGMLS